MQKFFGGCLFGVGILIAGLSGLCTFVVLGSMMMDPASANSMEWLPAALVFGGVPFVIGLGVFFLGRYLIQTAPDDPPGGTP